MDRACVYSRTGLGRVYLTVGEGIGVGWGGIGQVSGKGAREGMRQAFPSPLIFDNKGSIGAPLIG